MNKSKERADMPRVCAYCEKAVTLADDEQMLCMKYGVVSCSHVCGKFKYDPLKRKPTPLPPLITPDPDNAALD